MKENKFAQQHMQDLKSRFVILDEMRRFVKVPENMDKILDHNPKLLLEYEEYLENDEDIKIGYEEVHEINWEYCLFEAPIYELIHVFDLIYPPEPDRAKIKMQNIKGKPQIVGT